jgi:hypothetical protein
VGRKSDCVCSSIPMVTVSYPLLIVNYFWDRSKSEGSALHWRVMTVLNGGGSGRDEVSRLKANRKNEAHFSAASPVPPRHLYKTTVLSEKHVIAVYREFVDDGFLITAFMTSSPDTILRKGVVWQKPPTS